MSAAALSPVAELRASVDRSGVRRVRVLGWRDLADDEAGGSELHLHEIARRWADAGIEVTMRTSSAAGQPAREDRSGYSVRRAGGRMSVFPRTMLTESVGSHRGRYDALVEIWNGVPWFSPVWSGVPRVVWLHHVHGPMWNQTLGPVIGPIGRRLETRLAPRCYRSERIVTLAESSRRELIDELGLAPDRVSVVAPGIGARFSPCGGRSATPSVLAVGRLVPVKRFELLIEAVAAVRREMGDVGLTLVGDGYERARLTALVDRLDASGWVRFAGQIDDDELLALYRSSWVLASSSVAEGWGMTITEAAACGTPAVVTDIVGHRDAVRDGSSGLLVEPDGLAAGLTRVLADAALRSRLSTGALARAAELTWDHAATESFALLAEEVARCAAR